MKKEILIAIGITILFLGTCITPTIASDNVKKSSIPISSGNTLYVGGSGPGNYTTIQEAVENASDGDIVFVYSGNYSGFISITKSINLIGEDKNTTFISGPYTWIEVSTTNNVKIKSFTIKGDYNYLVRIVDSSNCTLYNNIIINEEFNYNIKCRSSSYIKIIKNYLKSGFIIIFVDECRKCDIENNMIVGYENPYYSIGIYLSESRYIKIIHNLITNCFGGIDVSYSKPVLINENNFIQNSGDAIFIHRRRLRVNWNGNYWGEARKYPKFIFGYLEIIPDTLLRPGIIFNWVNFDWFPAQEPYDI